MGYAIRYRETIPRADVARRYPFVINALSLMDLVTPLPRELVECVPPTRHRSLTGVGVVRRA